ncbi:alpha/beta hydrolase [Streptomyces sp. S1D4-11]
MGRACGTGRGGGTAPPSCCRSEGCRAWPRRCRAAARRTCPAASAVRGCPRMLPRCGRCCRYGDEPTVVVAHSYGGIITAEAAAGIESVRHLLLVSATCPRSGRACRSSGTAALPRSSTSTPTLKTFGVRPELLVDTFLQDCDPEVQAQAADHLARQSVQVTGQPVGAAAWQQVPSTYLVCTQDRGTPPRLQREFARRVGSVVELDA